MSPKLVLTYVPKAYTDNEGELETIGSFAMARSGESSCYSMKHTKVDLPNGETVSVVAEITDYGNTFSVRSNGIRLCSVKSEGQFTIAFLTPLGLELYAKIEQ